MKLSKKATAIFKPVGVDLSTYKINPSKKFNPKTAPGLKKGTGGVDGAALAAGVGGVSEGTTSFIRSLMNEAIEDITDTDTPTAQPGATAPMDNELESSGDEVADAMGVPEQEAIKRSVKGAHLVFKRQADVDSYEELWIYAVNPKDPQAHAKIEELILAGTDVSPVSMGSEDGSQRATSWIAGNAKMLHITGLVN